MALLAGMKSAPSVFLTIFTGKVKHKSSKMAGVHDLFSIPCQFCRPFNSPSLLDTVLVRTLPDCTYFVINKLIFG